MSDAKDAKFQIQFCMMMLLAGRNEEASVAIGKAMDALDRIIEKEEGDGHLQNNQA